MSRIGKNPIEIVQGVKVAVSGQTVNVEGPKGKLVRQIHGAISIEIKDSKISVTRKDDAPVSRALHGLTRTLLANMVKGVAQGYQKQLHIEGVGYRAAVAGKILNLTLGYSHPVVFPIPDGIQIAVEQQTEVTVTGADKELVGQVAANIRFLRKPEPYRGKGVRYINEVIRRKAGKTAASGGGAK